MPRRLLTPDLLAGGTFIALGVAFAVGGATYDLGTAVRMGPGYVPVLLGVCLAVLGALVVGQSLLARPAAAVTDDDQGPVPWARGALLVTAVVFFGATVDGLGLAPALLVSTFLAALAGHRASLVRALLTSAGLTALCLLVFVAALQLRLPLLGEWLGG